MLWNNPFTNYNQHGIFIFFLEILLNHFPLPPPSFSQKSSPFAHCCPQLVVEWWFPCTIDSAVFTPAYNYIWEKQMLAFNNRTEKLFWKAFSFPTCLPNVLAKQHQISLHLYLDLDLQEILSACFSLAVSAKCYQHQCCWQLCLCNGLQTILMDLHFTSNMSTTTQPLPPRLSTPCSREHASIQKAVLLHTQ